MSLNPPSPSRYKVWFVSTRPHTLPLSASTVLLGYGVAIHGGYSHGAILVLCLLTAVLLQVLSNFANDYGDVRKGVDNEQRLGPKRMIHEGHINLAQLRRALFVTGFFALVCGLWAIGIAHIQGWIAYMFFGLLGIASLLAAIGYTLGEKPYGYAGLGDLAVFVFFGLVPVCGTAVLAGAPLWGALLPACGAGFGGVAVLNINNIRDIENDLAFNKRTLATRLGRGPALAYQVLLVMACCLCFGLYMAPLDPYVFWMVILAALPLVYSTWKVLRHESAEDLNRELVRTFMAVSLLSSLSGLALFVI